MPKCRDVIPRSNREPEKPDFKDPNIVKHLSYLNEQYVVILCRQILTTIGFVCKLHYVKDLGIDSSLDNTTYTSTP